MARLGRGAMALLVFFPGAARARVVAADFCAGAHRFGSLGLRGSGLELQILLLAALALFDLSCFGFRPSWLHEEEESNRFGINAVHHVFEEGERFLFEFD